MGTDNGNVLAGRTAVVTGSTRGIGRAIAERFVAEGAHVVVHGRSAETAEVVAKEFGERAVGVGGDIARDDTARALVDAAIEHRGRIDILVNNAGVARDAYLTRITDDDWAETLAVNLSGPFQAMRAAVPQMKAMGGGSILNVVSYAGLKGRPGQVAYSASKGGLMGLTMAASKELGRFAIRVNALSPSARTDMTDEVGEDAVEITARRAPLRKLGTVEEVAEAALFLVSDRSSCTTGQVIHIDGGFHLQ